MSYRMNIHCLPLLLNYISYPLFLKIIEGCEMTTPDWFYTDRCHTCMYCSTNEQIFTYSKMVIKIRLTSSNHCRALAPPLAPMRRRRYTRTAVQTFHHSALYLAWKTALRRMAQNPPNSGAELHGTRPPPPPKKKMMQPLVNSNTRHSVSRCLAHRFVSFRSSYDTSVSSFPGSRKNTPEKWQE